MEYEINVEQIGPQTAAAVVRTVPITKIGPFISEAFGVVIAELAAQNMTAAGPPFARYTMLGDAFEVTAGFPTPRPIAGTQRVIGTTLPGGTVATTMHVGAYDAVKDAYDAVMSWLPEHGMHVAGDPWEVYLDGPEVAEPRTIIRVPCQSVDGS